MRTRAKPPPRLGATLANVVHVLKTDCINCEDNESRRRRVGVLLGALALGSLRWALSTELGIDAPHLDLSGLGEGSFDLGLRFVALGARSVSTLFGRLRAYWSNGSSHALPADPLPEPASPRARLSAWVKAREAMHAAARERLERGEPLSRAERNDLRGEIREVFGWLIVGLTGLAQAGSGHGSVKAFDKALGYGGQGPETLGKLTNRLFLLAERIGAGEPSGRWTLPSRFKRLSADRDVLDAAIKARNALTHWPERNGRLSDEALLGMVEAILLGVKILRHRQRDLSEGLKARWVTLLQVEPRPSRMGLPPDDFDALCYLEEIETGRLGHAYAWGQPQAKASGLVILCGEAKTPVFVPVGAPPLDLDEALT